MVRNKLYKEEKENKRKKGEVLKEKARNGKTLGR